MGFASFQISVFSFAYDKGDQVAQRRTRYSAENLPKMPELQEMTATN